MIGAKVVTNTRTPGSRCYGYVTMNSSSDAAKCISHLHRTELHGRIISVERAKSEIGGLAGKAKLVIAADAKKDDDSKHTKDGKKEEPKSAATAETKVSAGKIEDLDKGSGAETTGEVNKLRRSDSNKKSSTRSTSRTRGANNVPHQERNREVDRVRRERERQRLRERDHDREVLLVSQQVFQIC